MLSAFSPDGNEFLFCTSDNRISLWDMDKKKRRQQYVEKNHLVHSYTCLNWCHGTTDLGVLAVGCSDGTVVIWDLVRGVVSQVIGSNASSSGSANVPSDVSFSADGRSVYVISATSPDVSEYTTKTGEFVKVWKGHKKGIHKLAVNPKASVLALGSNSIKLIDTSSEGKKKKLDGHFPGGMNDLAFTHCGRYLACASANNREVLVFDVQAGASTDAILVLPSRQIVQRVVARAANGEISVLCIYDQGEGGCLLRAALESKHIHQIHIDARALGAAFSLDGRLLVAVGPVTQPQLSVVDVETDLPETITLPLEDAESIKARAKATHILSDLPLPTVLGPNEFGGSKRPLTEDSLTQDQKRSRSDSAEHVEGTDQTMEQRLAGLVDQLRQLDTPVAKLDSLPTPTPTSDSLVTLVDQALQTGDDALLEQCFGCDDVDVVEETSRRLPTGRIVLLLRRLVSKFEKRPSRGLLLTRWLAALLRHHTAYLVTVPDLTAQLAGLSQMLEQRLSSYSRLASLGGRLDLLLSRMSAADVGRSGNAEPKVPLMIVQD